MTNINTKLIRLSADFLMHAHINPYADQAEIADVVRGKTAPIDEWQAKRIQDSMMIIGIKAEEGRHMPYPIKLDQVVPKLEESIDGRVEEIDRFVTAANNFAHSLAVSRQDTFNIHSLVADGQIEAVSDDVVAELKRRELDYLVQAYDPEQAKKALMIDTSLAMLQGPAPTHPRG